MINIFQSIGITFTGLLLVALTIVTMYASYILGIGILLISIVYIIYKVLEFKKSRTSYF